MNELKDNITKIQDTQQKELNKTEKEKEELEKINKSLREEIEKLKKINKDLTKKEKTREQNIISEPISFEILNKEEQKDMVNLKQELKQKNIKLTPLLSKIKQIKNIGFKNSDYYFKILFNVFLTFYKVICINDSFIIDYNNHIKDNIEKEIKNIYDSFNEYIQYIFNNIYLNDTNTNKKTNFKKLEEFYSPNKINNDCIIQKKIIYGFLNYINIKSSGYYIDKIDLFKPEEYEKNRFNHTFNFVFIDNNSKYVSVKIKEYSVEDIKSFIEFFEKNKPTRQPIVIEQTHFSPKKRSESVEDNKKNTERFSPKKDMKGLMIMKKIPKCLLPKKRSESVKQHSRV